MEGTGGWMGGGDQQSLQKGTVRPPDFQITEVLEFKIQRRFNTSTKSLSTAARFPILKFDLEKWMLLKYRL